MVLRVAWNDGAGERIDYVTDVGCGGVFIRHGNPPEQGTRLRLKLSFPGLLEPTDLQAQVRWCRREGPDAGMGVQFLDTAQPAAQRLSALLRKLDAPGSSQLAPSAGRLRVLLVEDNPFVCELFHHAVRKYARQHAHVRVDVETLATGLNALRRLRQDPKPDVLIIDHYLPGATGCSVVRALRERPDWAQVPVLMISTGGPEVRREAFEAGVTLYLDKPVLLHQVIGTLGALVSVRSAAP